MAEKRMFAKTIIDSDSFLDMPATTQLLYFHLSMRADDEGFINKPKSIMRVCGCKDDDMKLLIAKKFIIPFESGIVVIKHWKIHNYIRADRLKSTKYTEEKRLLSLAENGAYTICQTSGRQLTDNSQTTDGQMAAQIRLDKISLEENRLEEERDRINYQEIVDMYNDTCVSFPRLKKVSETRKKSIKARMNSGYTKEDFETLFIKAESSNFLKGKNDRNWSATFDWLLKDSNMAKVLEGNYDNKIAQIKKEQSSGNRAIDRLREMGEI